MTLLLYTTEENFNPNYGLGTSFYNSEDRWHIVNCKHMNMVFFRDDIFHSLAASNIPNDIKTSRVSYVFKLIMNPTRSNQNIEKELYQFLNTIKTN